MQAVYAAQAARTQAGLGGAGAHSLASLQQVAGAAGQPEGQDDLVSLLLVQSHDEVGACILLLAWTPRDSASAAVVHAWQQ